MSDERINLLPPQRRRALTRDYIFRFGVVTMILVIMLALAAAILLVPTYMFLTSNIKASEVRLAGIESGLSSSDDKSLTTRLTSLGSNTTTLLALTTAPSASKIVREALALPRSGIAISTINYALGTAPKPSTLIFSGTATTRNALRNYQLAFQSAPFTLSATLPVSAYAMDTDIAFTITVTLAP